MLRQHNTNIQAHRAVNKVAVDNDLTHTQATHAFDSTGRLGRLPMWIGREQAWTGLMSPEKALCKYKLGF